jgi:hemolysin activation/secretion protein
MRKIAMGTLVSIISCNVLYAAPEIGDALRETQLSSPPMRNKSLPLIDYKVIDSKHLMSNNEKVLIKHFNFVGNSVLSKEILSSLLQEFQDKELTFGQIDEAVNRVTDIYRQKGYFLARAYLPVQEINDHSLNIGVIEGYYGEIQLNNNSSVNTDVLQNYLDAIDTSKPISLDSVEKAVLLINDLDCSTITSARFSQGKEVGTSNFTVDTAEGSFIKGYLFADNYGSRYTGYNRMSAGGTFNSLFHHGEKISFGGTISNDSDLASGHFDYEMPIGGDGFIPHFSFFQTYYDLGKEYSSLDAHGKAYGASVGATYYLLKTRGSSLVFTTDVKRQFLSDSIDTLFQESKKRSTTVNVGFGWSKEDMIFGVDGKTMVSASWTGGKIDFLNSADAIADAKGGEAQGKFNKINLDAFRLFNLVNSVNLNVYMRGQYVIGNKNLDGSEEMSIGGANGVRFFSPSEQNGDNGYVYGAELFYALPISTEMRSMVSLFADSGKTWQDVPLNGEIKRSLHDVGIGCYLDYKNFFGKVFVAKEIGNAEILSDKGYETKFLMQGGLVF